ncbi:ABC transporter substrate-binding protein, partial [Streptomyces avermitilis]
MTNHQPSRRRILAGLGAAGTTALLSGCVTSTSSQKSSSKGAVTLQSNLSAPQAKAAMEDLVAAFAKKGSRHADLNTVAAETFRTQLPTYLTSANPPDVYTWYPGSVADAYAKKNLLLDLDDVWASPELKGYSKALHTLCTASSGKKVFVPTTYYW